MAAKSSFTHMAASTGRYLANEQSYAAYSALALIAVQVTIGITMKLAQNDGEYAFSPSGSIAISEFLKMVLSAVFFFKEWRSRTRYARIEVQEARRMSPLAASLMRDGRVTDEEAADDPARLDEEDPLEDMDWGSGKKLGAETFWEAARNEVSGHIVFGLCGLALCYVLVNNLVGRKSGPGCARKSKAKYLCCRYSSVIDSRTQLRSS
jgi:hypothetical protein